MKDGDRKKFYEAWCSCYELVGAAIPTTRALQMAFEALRDFELAEICGALRRHARSSPYSPKPSDIVNICHGTADDRARRAWLNAKEMLRVWGSYETVSLSDPKSHYAINAMGGWVAFGAFTLDELPFREKDFLRHYGEAERAQLDWDSPGVPGELLGHTALSNKMVADAPNVIVRRSLDRPRTEAREAIDRRGKESPYALPGPDISSEQATANVDRIKALTDRFCREKLLAGELDETEAAS